MEDEDAEGTDPDRIAEWFTEIPAIVTSEKGDLGEKVNGKEPQPEPEIEEETDDNEII